MTIRMISLLVLVLTACGDRAVVYVYPDAPVGDAPQLGDVFTDLPALACLPDRSAGSVSSADCHRYADAPVCDGWTDRCTALPVHYCGACETDEQCRLGVDLRSECVFIPYEPDLSGTVFHYNDQACLSPCEADLDCGFLPLPEWFGVRCLPLPRGRYCVVPFADGADTPTCSDFHGGRRGLLSLNARTAAQGYGPWACRACAA